MNDITAKIAEGGQPPDLESVASVGVGGTEIAPKSSRVSMWNRPTAPEPEPVELTIEALTGCDYHQLGTTLRDVKTTSMSDQALRAHVQFLGQLGEELLAISSAGRLRDFSREEQESERVRRGNESRSKMNVVCHLFKAAQIEEHRRFEASRPRPEPEPSDADRIRDLEARIARLEASPGDR